MPARIRVRRRFREDVERQEAWLAEHAPRAWLEAFFEGLDAARRRLIRSPELGIVLKADQRVVLRELSFARRLPYIVQYVHEPVRPIRQLWLVRLFHYGQYRKEPDPSGWPW
jgi:hypothetical protein